MKRVSLTRIAREAGVSVSTVSRVVNDAPGIAPKTRQAVYSVMERLQYQPRLLTHSGATRPARIITLILTDVDENVFENPFFLFAMKGANSCARERGYHIMVSFCTDTDDQLSYLHSVVPGRPTDGLVLFSIEREDRSVRYLQEQKLPFCVIGRPAESEQVLWVDNDNFQAMYRAVTDLIDRGCRRIAFISSDWSRTYTRDRYGGYCQALRQRGIEPSDEYYEPHTSETVSQSAEHLGYVRMNRMLSRVRPDAVVGTDDLVAFGAQQALIDAGIEDVSVLGVNNSPRARFRMPTLSSIEIHPEQLGYAAAELLIDSLNATVKPPAHRIVDATIIHRESTGGPADGTERLP